MKGAAIREARSDRFFLLITRLTGVLVMFLILYPIYYVVIASFSDPSAVISGRVWLFPKGFSLEGYAYLLSEGRIWIGYRNTIFYTLAATALSLFLTVPAAYALSRRDFKARRPLMLFFLFTMYFSGGLIPTYLLVANILHMDNSVWVMVVPFSLNVYNMIIVRSYFESSIPEDLWEAAQLEGCSHARYLTTIAIPLSKAVLSVVMLYYIVGKWNEYFNAMIYLRNEQLVPLQLVLRDILIQNETTANSMSGGVNIGAVVRRVTLIKYTSIIIGTLPMMILYPFIQKYFEKGVMIGAVKG